jgi:hypothetical protein
MPILGILIVAVAMTAMKNIEAMRTRARARKIILLKESPPTYFKTCENLIYLWYEIKHSLSEAD